MNFVELNMLQKKIGYYFKHRDLLLQALTHRSFSDRHNERLEFLGDAILNYIIASLLYHKYFDYSEGEMSRIRANMVCAHALSGLAKKFDLGSYLKLGQGELKNGGDKRESILSNTIEALIGGIFLDSNIQTTELLIHHWYDDELIQNNFQNKRKDPKTRLQEYLQHHQMPLPVYYIDKITGHSHEQIFTINCQISELNYPIVGCGSSRRKAEQEAAIVALQELVKINND